MSASTLSVPATSVPPREGVRQIAVLARRAARALATADRGAKDAALHAVAEALVEHTDRIVSANAEDLSRAGAEGMSVSLQDRLRLDGSRIAAIAAAVRTIADLPDPVGEVVRGNTL